VLNDVSDVRSDTWGNEGRYSCKSVVFLSVTNDEKSIRLKGIVVGVSGLREEEDIGASMAGEVYGVLMLKNLCHALYILGGNSDEGGVGQGWHYNR
jgi:hypothetical protein